MALFTVTVTDAVNIAGKRIVPTLIVPLIPKPALKSIGYFRELQLHPGEPLRDTPVTTNYPS